MTEDRLVRVAHAPRPKPTPREHTAAVIPIVDLQRGALVRDDARASRKGPPWPASRGASPGFWRGSWMILRAVWPVITAALGVMAHLFFWWPLWFLMMGVALSWMLTVATFRALAGLWWVWLVLAVVML